MIKKTSVIPRILALLSLVVMAFLPSWAFALTFTLPKNGDNVIGEVQHAVVEPGDNFCTIARRYDVGYYELVEANPDLKPDAPTAWSNITIPTRFILPHAPHEGIVVSLAELRLYYYPPNQNIVITYPVGIGREGWKTPVGLAKVTAKEKDPVWTVPASIQQDTVEQGLEPFPAKVGPGPDNPLGKFALRLSLPTYLIHGTNKPDAIGTRSTAGCIRMFPEDIESLFNQVRKGTRVHIVDEAYKVGWLDNQLYLEVHLPLQEQQMQNGDDVTPIVKAVTMASIKHKVTIDWDKTHQVADSQSGIPEEIGKMANSNLSDASAFDAPTATE